MVRILKLLNTEALTNEMQKIGDAMAKSNTAGTCPTDAPEEKKDENIKDAEYKESK